MTNWTWAGSLIYPCFDCSYFFFTSALRSGRLFVVLFADLALPTYCFGIHGQGGGGGRCNVSSTHVPAATLWMMQVTSSPRTCPPARQPANQPAKLKKTQFRMVSVEPQKVRSIICGLGTGGLERKITDDITDIRINNAESLNITADERCTARFALHK